jgi:heavy metal sensor kinase
LFRSLRLRLTLWYALTLVVILAASGLFWHQSLARHLQQQIDQRLLLVAEDLAAFHRDRANAIDCADVEHYLRLHNWGEYVQLLTLQGELRCASSNLRDFQLPRTAAALQHSLRGEHHFATVYVEEGAEDDKDIQGTGMRGLSFNQEHSPLRLLTYPLVEHGKTVHLLQVGSSMATPSEALRQLRFILLVFSPLALLLLSFTGWFLAGRALGPVNLITRSAGRINADNLAMRLPVQGAGTEMARLAETINAMLARLEESFKKVKQFAGDASHELRTPLAILRGETEVTLRWARSPEEYRLALESNLEEIDRMGRIIDDLLALARSDAGQMPLTIKEISLSDLLQEMYLQGRTLGEGKDIDIVLLLDVQEEIRLRGDELRLRQIFLNLISNGIKYTPAGGRVEIELGIDGTHAVVAIRDNGIGIPPQHLPHIFDRFYRIDKARNREDGGTGLGLAITKAIVEAHDGSISVASTPGHGSAFTVYLPLQGPMARGAVQADG